MQAEVYRVGERERVKNKRKRRLIWTIIIILILLLLTWGFFYVKARLKPDTKITQSAAVKTTVRYDTKTTHYDEGVFSVDVLSTLKPVPRPAGPYKSFTWLGSDSGTNGEQLQILVDTIPANFAVNRVLIVSGNGDHLSVDGSSSDNCSKYTLGTKIVAGETGVAAKWQGVNFLCDQSNQERDVIGTSSTDGVNTVLLKSPSNGQTHKFFFIYTNQNNATPDYAPFYNALNSLKMQ